LESASSPSPRPFLHQATRPGGSTEQKRLYYLLDASALVHLYLLDEEVTPCLDHLIEQRGLQKAFLYVPNFCVAETFNTIARKHYREGVLDEQAYKKCKGTFAHDIHNGHLLYHHELNRYHILNVDYIIPFEHLFPSERPDGTERRLSIFDVLIIAMGMELRVPGGATYVVTGDKRTTEVIDILRKLRKEERQHYGVPDYIKFPRSIYLWGKRVSKVLGQWWVITIEGVLVSVDIVESEFWSSCSLSIVYSEHSRKCCLTEQKEGKTIALYDYSPIALYHFYLIVSR